MRIGYKLAAEAVGPNELSRQAVLAEQAGFDFVEMSDHYHPWIDVQGHSCFAWTALGAIAAKTVTYDFERLMEGARLLSCSEFGDAIIAHM